MSKIMTREVCEGNWFTIFFHTKEDEIEKIIFFFDTDSL